MKRLLVISMVWITCTQCVEPYEAKDLGNASYLVIDAQALVGQSYVSARITESIRINSEDEEKVVTKASVNLESKDGEIARLVENTKAGIYEKSNVSLEFSKPYRLKVVTKEGRVYYSAWVEGRPTPPIDSITYSIGSQNSRVVEVSTHDPANSTRYYRWEAFETYEYRSSIESFMVWERDSLRILREEERKHRCFKTQQTTSINIANTTNLANDVVFKKEIQAVSPASTKMDFQYSILVKQYAISEDEFQYWNMLRSSTETNGGLLDPQPTQVSGNFYSESNPEELVLGYFSVYSVQELRKTWTSAELQQNWFNIIPKCTVETIIPNGVYSLGSRVLIDRVYQDGVFVGYSVVEGYCADCTLDEVRKGTNVRPPYMK